MLFRGFFIPPERLKLYFIKKLCDAICSDKWNSLSRLSFMKVLEFCETKDNEKYTIFQDNIDLAYHMETFFHEINTQKFYFEFDDKTEQFIVYWDCRYVNLTADIAEEQEKIYTELAETIAGEKVNLIFKSILKHEIDSPID